MEVDTPPISSVEDTTPIITVEEKSIEEQMVELEKEVMGLRTRQNTPIDIDEPEEGEISDPPPPTLPIQHLAPPSIQVLSTSLPNRSSRGMKRPNAEDMENRPTSLPTRPLPIKRRSVFGGFSQRPNRLIINLDDSDSEDDDDAKERGGERFAKFMKSGTATPIPIPIPISILGTGEDETLKLFREKEEGIRRLKEQIAERVRVQQMKSNEGVKEGTNTPEVEVVNEAMKAVVSGKMLLLLWELV